MFKLYATLPVEKREPLRKLIQNATVLGNITPKNLFYNIQNNGIDSPFFQPISQFFDFLFGNYNQTTISQDNHLWIGTGIDLTATPSALALFYEMDPKQDWKDILAVPGEPNPPLTQDQINQLLYLSLVGVSNNYGNFPGYLIGLNNCLNGLTNQEFPTNQLISITSLICLRKGILPPNLTPAIQHMLTNKMDLAPMQMIVEYSNLNASIPMQNKLLEVGAIFHGETQAEDLDVYLTQRQKGRLLIANTNSTVEIANGPVKRGLPVGNYQENSFAGFENVTVIPSFNPIPNSVDTDLFGTVKADNLVSHYSYSDVGVTIYGGDKADYLNVNFDFQHNTPQLAFLAGNEGDDTYVLSMSETKTFVSIYDSDRRGKIFINNGVNISFSGFIIDGAFCPGNGNLEFQSKAIIEQDNSTTLQFSWSNRFNIEIFSYLPWQFNVLPDTETHYVAGLNSALVTGAITPKGKIGLNDLVLDNYLYIYDANNNFNKKVSLFENNTAYDVSFQAARDENFYVGFNQIKTCELIYSVVNSDEGNITSKVIDSSNLPNCTSSRIFSSLETTPTNADNQEIVLLYLKQETLENQRGLYAYVPSQGTKRVTTVKNIDYLDNLYVAPTHDGFFAEIKGLRDAWGHSSNELFWFSSTGDVARNTTWNNATVLGLSPLSNGYLLFGQNITTGDKWEWSTLYTMIYSNNEWSSPTILSRSSIDEREFNAGFGGKKSYQLQKLPNDHTLILSANFNLGGYILNAKNEIKAGPFRIAPGCTYPLQTLYSSILLPSGDIKLLYSPPEQVYTIQQTVTLPTSYLFQESDENIQEKIPAKPKVKPEKSPELNNKKRSKIKIQEDDESVNIQDVKTSQASSLSSPYKYLAKSINNFAESVNQYFSVRTVENDFEEQKTSSQLVEIKSETVRSFFDNLSGNIGLLAIGVHAVKKVWNNFNAAEEDDLLKISNKTGEIIFGDTLSKEINALDEQLQKIRTRLKQYPQINSITYKDALEECTETLEQLKNMESVDFQVLDELKKDVKCIMEDSRDELELFKKGKTFNHESSSLNPSFFKLPGNNGFSGVQFKTLSDSYVSTSRYLPI